MSDPLVIKGVVRPRRPSTSIAGYALSVQFRLTIEIEAGSDPLVAPISGSTRLEADGAFQLEFPPTGTPTGPVTLSVTSPSGVMVHTQELTLDEIRVPLRLRIQTVDAVDVVPSSDPTLGARARISGQVIDHRGRSVPAGLAVVIWGVDRVAGTPPPARPLVVTKTQTEGRFSADWPPDVLAEGFARVGDCDPAPIPLDVQDRLPLTILIVINLDQSGSPGETPCTVSPPRAPDPIDLTSNPKAFSQDLGGGCVDLTTPNRALEEFSYFMVVRTSEPRVRGLTLGVRRTVPRDLLVDLLGVSIASQAMGLTRSAPVRLASTDLTLDVNAARSLVRSDRPPTVAEIARASWLSEVTHTKGLVDAALQPALGRTILDADHQIDWDYTPTIHLALDIAHGHLLHFKEIWRADGYSLGDLVYSLPLAPGQRRQVAVIDWDRRTESAREERLEFEEHLDALLSRDREVLEMVGTDLNERISAGSRNTTWGAAGGLGAGFIGSGFGIFGGVAGGGSGSGSTSWQDAARTFSADSMQHLRDRISQRASSLRSERSSVVQSVSQGETFRAETEVVANYNRCHSMTIEYFQVLRHFLITHELADVEECLFVPFPINPFDRAKTLRWRESLTRSLRDRNLSAGFAAIERIADNWVGWDFPEARYSQEAPESIEGELRIGFLLPRPRDDADGRYQVDMWRPFAPFLPIDTLELFTAKLNEKSNRERDRVFREEIAPGIAERLVQKLRLAFVGSDGGETEVPIDATLVSRYAETQPLYVTINLAGGVPAIPREDITYVKIWYDAEPLPPDAQVVVHSGRLRYQAPHITGMLFDNNRILNDIKEGDAVLIATPVTQRELRDPRQEDREIADRLVAHLNDHLEFYHQVIWLNLDAQRRYMLLDAVLVPGLDGKSIASVCTNELIGIVGNSLVLPVAPGQRLDPTLEQPDPEKPPVRLVNAYAAPPTPPLRVSVPTRGVFAEAVTGACNACEEIDDTRYWRWSTEGQLELPQILPVSTETRASDEPDLTPTPLPAPLVQIQNAPAVPNPVGLGGAFQLLATPGLFTDITGLEGTQRNARAAFEASLSAASSLGDEAFKLASQQELGRNAEKMINRIEQARSSGLLSQSAAESLTSSALSGLVGEPRPQAESPTSDPAVNQVIDQAAQSSKADIKVSTPSETVEVSFDDDRQVIGAANNASAPFELKAKIPQPVLVEIPETGDLTPFVLDTLDSLTLIRSASVMSALAAAGLVTPNPADPTRYLIERRLRIVHPVDPAAPDQVAGSGRLPVVAIVHGQHASWHSSGVTLNLNGYAELQADLARRGIISVSVDTNAANFFGSFVEMRAQMVLGALDALRGLDLDPTSRFFGRLDFNKVGLVGHSRGGEAVVRAAQINRGRLVATKFGIEAVCSLAPTDFSGTTSPGPRILTTADTSFYAVVYGALDGDVAGLGGAKAFGGTGFRLYDRALCDKAMVFLDGCNHNRFNSVWASDGDDRGSEPQNMVNGKRISTDPRLLSTADHETLLSEYVGGLFGWRLTGDSTAQGFFDGNRANRLSAGVSLQWSFGAGTQVLDDMEDPVKPRTVNSSTIDVFADFPIGARVLDQETNHQTTILAVEPSAAAGRAYEISMRPAETDWSGFSALTFRVCGDFDLANQAAIDADPLPDFSVVVIDANGASARVEATALASPQVPRRPVFHPARRHDDTIENCTVLRLETMAIPLTSFGGVDLTKVASVQIDRPAGHPKHLFFDSLQLVRS